MVVLCCCPIESRGVISISLISGESWHSYWHYRGFCLINTVGSGNAAQPNVGPRDTLATPAGGCLCNLWSKSPLSQVSQVYQSPPPGPFFSEDNFLRQCRVRPSGQRKAVSRRRQLSHWGVKIGRKSRVLFAVILSRDSYYWGGACHQIRSGLPQTPFYTTHPLSSLPTPPLFLSSLRWLVSLKFPALECAPLISVR